MTFAQKQGSVDEGSPASLYLFRYGPGSSDVFAYTDAGRPVTYNSITYSPNFTIAQLNGLEASGGLDNNTLEIEIDPQAALIAFYRQNRIAGQILLTIFQGHLSDPDNEYVAFFTGRVLTVEEGLDFATAFCEPVQTSLRRPGLTRTYGRGCPYYLYDPKTCKVSRALFERTETPVTITTNVLGFVDGWQGSIAKDRYFRGEVRWTSSISGRPQVRSILKSGNTPDELILSGNTNGLNLGDSVVLTPGCNRARGSGGDCTEIYGNDVNYGGQEDIPLESPVGFTRNNFY